MVNGLEPTTEPNSRGGHGSQDPFSLTETLRLGPRLQSHSIGASTPWGGAKVDTLGSSLLVTNMIHHPMISVTIRVQHCSTGGAEAYNRS